MILQMNIIEAGKNVRSGRLVSIELFKYFQMILYYQLTTNLNLAKDCWLGSSECSVFNKQA